MLLDRDYPILQREIAPKSGQTKKLKFLCCPPPGESRNIRVFNSLDVISRVYLMLLLCEEPRQQIDEGKGFLFEFCSRTSGETYAVCLINDIRHLWINKRTIGCCKCLNLHRLLQSFLGAPFDDVRTPPSYGKKVIIFRYCSLSAKCKKFHF